jgi:hypothetical protein
MGRYDALEGFNSLNQSLQENALNEVARNKLAMEEKRLGFEGERLGFERALQPFKVQTAQQQVDTGKLEYEKNLSQRFGGIGQAILAETDPAKQQQYVQQIYSHPKMREMLDRALPPGWQSNPALVGHFTSQIAHGYKDPGAAALQAAQTAEATGKGALAMQQSKAKTQVNAVTGEYYNQMEAPPVSNAGPQGALIFGKEFAKTEAPKLYAESSRLYGDAADTHNIMGTLEELAPYAKTGFAGPQLLQLRKLGTQLGIKDPSIAPTELFQFLAQKGVFELTKQLKPASNLDMIASERATASLQSDPSTLPAALPVLKAVAQRSMIKHQLEMEFYKRGMPPDTPAIMAEVNKQVPFDLSGVTKVQNGPAAGPQVQKQNTGALPQAPAPGTVKTGRDGVPYRFKGGNPADANSWERAQ